MERRVRRGKGKEDEKRGKEREKRTKGVRVRGEGNDG